MDRGWLALLSFYFIFLSEERPGLATESWCTEPAEPWVWRPVNWPKRTVIRFV
jgi:hypothetical protein